MSRAAWCAAGVAWLVAAAAAADQVPPEVAIGVGGRFRAGSWTPLVVAGAAADGAVRVAVQDPDGEFVRSPPAMASGTGSRFLVRCGRPVARLRIEDPTRGSVSDVDLPAPLPSTSQVWLVLGDLPALGRTARLMPGADGARPVVIAAAATDAVTTAAGSARDFDGVDVVVACGNALVEVDAAVVTGVDAWIRDGGRLVLAAGTSAPALAARSDPAAGWLPGPVGELVPLRGFAAIETHARASGLGGRPTAMDLRVPLLANRGSLAGAVDVFEGNAATDVPLVVRRAHGLGSITWVGLDLDAEPFRGWVGTDTLLVRLLGGRTVLQDDPRPAATRGPADLAGQLRLALEAPGPADGIGPVSFAFVAGLGLLYVACSFPLDWWLVSRSGRPWIAWISLPALVAAFTAAGWAAATRAWPPAVDREPARFAEVVDVDASDGAVRAASWLVVSCRDNTAVDVAVDAAAQGTGAAVSWFADSGPGFGGVDAAVPHPTLAAADYTYGATLARLEGVPVAAASSRLFEAGWSGTTPAPVTSTLVRDGQGTLRGSFAHHLPFTLVGCRLAHGGWLYDVGDLAPGHVHDLAKGRGPRSLAGALARRDAVRERQANPRWEPTGTDLSRILEVAGFHAAAGGRGYTGLESGRLARLDLSPLLPLDRAILVATAVEAPSGWTTAWRITAAARPTPRPTACSARLYRIVIPLGAAPADSRGAPKGAE